ncbi:hypothetical protein LCGC14_0580680 [marine sediment metagenome]|uniref:Uncharacterized protein n=1 Tax=marine sediment metagenome TaxID=412755 RepID=A0A0F9U2N3_9ZZZZ
MTESEKMMKMCVNVLFESIIEVLYADPHQWSTRPCITCKTVTSITGKPFGCDRYREEKEKRSES